MKWFEQKIVSFRHDCARDFQQGRIALPKPLSADLAGHLEPTAPVRRQILGLNYREPKAVGSADLQKNEIRRYVIGAGMDTHLK